MEAQQQISWFEKNHNNGKEVLEAVVDRIIPYLEECDKEETPVIKLRTAEQILSEIDFKTKRAGIDSKEMVNLIDKILDLSVRTQHKHFHNQLFAQTTPEALAGEILTAFTNGNMFTFEIAPVFICIERVMLERLRKYVGWKDGQGDGILCPGGSMSTMYGMNIARHYKWPEIKLEGNAVSGKVAIFMNEAGHYSVKKGASFLGLGLNSIYYVKTDKEYGMDETHLKEQIQKAKDDGRTPYQIVATCATTVFGSYDDIEMCSRVCKEEKMWQHLDGALGGSLLVSKKWRHMQKGAHLADSITWNAHKMLGVPLQCSAFLTKHEGLLAEAHSANAAYLFQKDRLNADCDTGDKSLQCGRKVDILKLWINFKIQGENGLEERIDRMMDLSRHLRDQIIKRGKKHGAFKLVSDVYMTNVCFWFIPPSARGDNAPPVDSKEWRELVNNGPVVVKARMQEKGSAMIGYQSVPINGDSTPPNFFRFALSNPYLSKNDMDYLLDEIEELGKDL